MAINRLINKVFPWWVWSVMVVQSGGRRLWVTHSSCCQACWFSVVIIKARIPLLTFTKRRPALTRSQINLHLFSSTPLILNNGNEDWLLSLWHLHTQEMQNQLHIPESTKTNIWKHNVRAPVLTRSRLHLVLKCWFTSRWSPLPAPACLSAQNMKWKLNTVNLQCEEEGSARVGSVASNRLCFLPCKRLMCAECSDTDECKEFAVKSLQPFWETRLETGCVELAPRPPEHTSAHMRCHKCLHMHTCQGTRPSEEGSYIKLVRLVQTSGMLFICFGSEVAALMMWWESSCRPALPCARH